MFIFNSQERESPRFQRGRPEYQQLWLLLKGNRSVSLPPSLRRSRLGGCWLERLTHLADGPLGAGENVCVCLTVQNKREKQVGAGIEGVSEDQCLFDFYEAEQEESHALSLLLALSGAGVSNWRATFAPFQYF